VVRPQIWACQQKSQPGSGKRRVLERLGSIGRLSVDEHEPGIEIVGQHGQLEMILVGDKNARRIRSQSCIVIRFFDQVLGTGSLTIKPDEIPNRFVHVGHKNSILVLLGCEQLILHIVRFLFVIRVLLITQGNEQVCSVPALGLVPEFTLFTLFKRRAWRRLPLGRNQLLNQASCFASNYDEPAIEFLVSLPAMSGSRAIKRS
jgi:hypothetical protein